MNKDKSDISADATPSAGSLLFSDININNNNKDSTSATTVQDARAIGESGTVHELKQKAYKLSKDLDFYHMSGAKRGQAIIINNENFHWCTGMNKRTGTDVDAKNLKQTFKKLGFDVTTHKDTPCVELHEIIQNAATANHTGNDCFVCAILSHGDDGCIYGTDGIIRIKAIVDQFRGDNCSSLAGKPKIFIFQACRGTKHEIPVSPSIDVVDGPVEEDQEDTNVVVTDSAPKPTLPSGSDFLFCYSVVEGFYSHRDTLYGSWYVQDFTTVVEDLVLKAGKDSYPVDFLDILTKVNQKVSNRRVERSLSASSLGKKQMPCFLSMLTKKLYLTPPHK